MSDAPILGGARRDADVSAASSRSIVSTSMFPSGVVQAIIGPNGSGKTTLLNALSGASHADMPVPFKSTGRELFRLKPHRIARLGLAADISEHPHL